MYSHKCRYYVHPAITLTLLWHLLSHHTTTTNTEEQKLANKLEQNTPEGSHLLWQLPPQHSTNTDTLETHKPSRSSQHHHNPHHKYGWHGNLL